MAFSDRFTGEGLVVKVTPTGGGEITVTDDMTSFGYSIKYDNEDVTAGNSEEKENLPTKSAMTFSLDVFGGDDDTWNAVIAARTGSMVVMRKGEGNGLPVFEFNYVLDGFDPKLGTDKAEEITITGSRTGAMVQDFDSVQGAIRHLVFTTQPTNTASTDKIASVVVSIEDASNAVVTTEQSDVITITKTGASVASGVLSVRVINGVASFPGIVMTGTATGETLTATSSKGYTSATSNTFNVT